MTRAISWCLLALAACSSPATAPAPLPGPGVVPAVSGGPVAPGVAVAPPVAAPAGRYDAAAAVARVEGGAQWFEWPPLAGGRYGLFVFDATSPLPVWAWEGTTTRVRFGDVANLEEDVQAMLRSEADRGAQVRPPPAGAQWSFIAFDASGNIAGVRARGPL